MQPIKLALIGLGLAAIVTPPLLAQEGAAPELYRSHLTLSLTEIPRASTDTLGGDYGSFGGFVDATFPIASGGATDGLAGPRFRLLGRLRFGADSADFDFLREKRTIYTAHAGVTAWYRAGEKDFVLFSPGASFAEEDRTIGNPELRFSGALLGIHRSSPALLLDYGLVYSYVYGRGRLLPVFGLRWTPEREWIVSALLPVSLSVRRRVGAGASVGLVVSPLGERVRFENKTEFPGQPATVNFRLRQFRIGAEAVLRAGRRTVVTLEAGALVARKLSFANGDEDFLSTSVKPAAYGRVSLRVPFGAEP